MLRLTDSIIKIRSPVDDLGSDKGSTLAANPGTNMDNAVASSSGRKNFVNVSESIDDPSHSSLNVSLEFSDAVATLEPYIPAINSQKRSNKRDNWEYKKRTKNQTLPGLFESISYIQYLTLKLDDDQRIQNSDFFEIHRQIYSCLGREPKIVFQGDGSILVEVTSLEEKEKLLSLTELSGKSARCSPHKLMNQCKGVIRAPLLMQFSEERLQKEFESQSVIEVKQMKKKINGTLTALPTYILTFDLPRLPKEIKAAWLYFGVRPYIPAPRRCYYCHRFGHVNDNCRRRLKGEEKICYNCGQEDHGECHRTSYCINCQENHPSISKTCDRYILEKEILAFRSKEHVTYLEAKKNVLSQCIRPGITFASILKKSTSIIKPNKPNNPVETKKSPSVSRKMEVTSAKRKLSREEQEISPLSKSNRFDILSDELDCADDPAEVGPHVDSLGQELAPPLSVSVIHAEVLASASPPGTDDIPVQAPSSLDQGEKSTLVSAPKSAETGNLVGCQEQPKEMECSTSIQKKCGNESTSEAGSIGSGAAGSVGSGAAGSVGSGTAGGVGSGSAGCVGSGTASGARSRTGTNIGVSRRIRVHTSNSKGKKETSGTTSAKSSKSKS